MTTIAIEHLELAALAAGRRIAIAPTGRDTFAIDADTMKTWRPHTDPGDAARLAVRLDLWASTDRKVAFAAEDPDVQRSSCHHVRHDGTEPDKLRATARPLPSAPPRSAGACGRAGDE